MRARKQAQPLAQRRPADAELGRELLLGAETLAGPQAARREVAADLERDLLARHPAAASRKRVVMARTSRRGPPRPRAAAARSRPARPGSTSSSVSSSSACPRDRPRRAPERPRETGDVDREARPGRRAAGLLGEPVHDRVAAVRQDHEQRAGVVVRRAPERLDRVQRRAVADDRDDGPIRPRHAQADRGGQGEAEAAHGGAQRAERLARRQAHEQLGPVRRRLLDHRSRCAGCARRSRRRRARRAAARRPPEARAGRAAARRGDGVPERAGSARASSAHTGPGAASTARSALLRCTSAGSSLTIATRRAGLDERPGDERVLPEHRRADGEHEVVRRQRLAQADAVGRQVAGEQRVILREPGARAERLLPDRAREPLGQRDERLPGLGIVGACPDHERRARSAGDELGELGDGAARRRRELARRGAARRARPARPHRRAQSSIGTITSAGPLPVTASWHARAIAPGTSWARTGWSTQTGYSPASPRSLPARNGSVARWRRSCWPTTTTSGCAIDARGGERADRVAEAGGRVQDRERRLAAPDRPARRHADDRALVQRRARTGNRPAGRRAA